MESSIKSPIATSSATIVIMLIVNPMSCMAKTVPRNDTGSVRATQNEKRNPKKTPITTSTRMRPCAPLVKMMSSRSTMLRVVS